jgi:SET domain-containing protein
VWQLNWILYLNNSYDATKEPDDGLVLGRLVNDGYKHADINSKMKMIEANGQPILCLFATKHISPGEEIQYDYGQHNYAWRENNVKS